MTLRVLAIYLPQFHEIEENNIWWGEGYTEWTAVKSASKLSKHHYQPRIPINHDYYDLGNQTIKVFDEQIELAKNYGINGFAIYHYWFNGKKILHKPAEVFLKNPSLKIDFIFIWANETWTRTWYSKKNEILIQQTYGNMDDWKEHFNYLKDFFLDERYIKLANTPVIAIYKTNDILEINALRDLWTSLAIELGFDGIYLISSLNSGVIDKRKGVYDAFYEFEPGYTLKHRINIVKKFQINLFRIISGLINAFSKVKVVTRTINIDIIIKSIVNRKKVVDVYPGAFVGWDNTPRRGLKGTIYYNNSPIKFREQLVGLKRRANKEDLIFINAWNEWGEGCYLEPDLMEKYNYLEQVKKVFGNEKV